MGKEERKKENSPGTRGLYLCLAESINQWVEHEKRRSNPLKETHMVDSMIGENEGSEVDCCVDSPFLVLEKNKDVEYERRS